MSLIEYVFWRMTIWSLQVSDRRFKFVMIIAYAACGLMVLAGAYLLYLSWSGIHDSRKAR